MIPDPHAAWAAAAAAAAITTIQLTHMSAYSASAPIA